MHQYSDLESFRELPAQVVLGLSAGLQDGSRGLHFNKFDFVTRNENSRIVMKLFPFLAPPPPSFFFQEKRTRTNSYLWFEAHTIFVPGMFRV